MGIVDKVQMVCGKVGQFVYWVQNVVIGIVIQCIYGEIVVLCVFGDIVGKGYDCVLFVGFYIVVEGCDFIVFVICDDGNCVMCDVGGYGVQFGGFGQMDYVVGLG